MFEYVLEPARVHRRLQSHCFRILRVVLLTAPRTRQNEKVFKSLLHNQCAFCICIWIAQVNANFIPTSLYFYPRITIRTCNVARSYQSFGIPLLATSRLCSKLSFSHPLLPSSHPLGDDAVTRRGHWKKGNGVLVHRSRRKFQFSLRARNSDDALGRWNTKVRLDMENRSKESATEYFPF